MGSYEVCRIMCGRHAFIIIIKKEETIKKDEQVEKKINTSLLSSKGEK